MSRRAVLVVLIGLAAGCVDELQLPSDPTEPGASVQPEEPVEPRYSGPVDPALLALRSPARLASTPSGRLLVSDYYRGLVLVVDPRTLEPEAALKIGGHVLAVGLWGGRTFAGNATTKTVEVYGANGEWRFSFGGGPGAVEDPTDLAIDRALGLVFVVDGRRKLVKVFDVNGHLKRSISGLTNPTGIALDTSRREVLVSDFGNLSGFAANGAIKIFDYDGQHLREISGQAGGGSSGFSRPQGLAVGAGGRIYVVDSFRGEVLLLDRATGQQVGKLGSYGSSAGQLMLPLDVLIGKKGDVFVTSNQTAKIERFSAGAPR